jgi:predicted DNA-binding transcriptional regulator
MSASVSHPQTYPYQSDMQPFGIQQQPAILPPFKLVIQSVYLANLYQQSPLSILPPLRSFIDLNTHLNPLHLPYLGKPFRHFIDDTHSSSRSEDEKEIESEKEIKIESHENSEPIAATRVEKAAAAARAAQTEREILIYSFIKEHLIKNNKQPYMNDIVKKFHIAKRAVVKIIREFVNLGLLKKDCNTLRIRKYSLPNNMSSEAIEIIRNKK